MKMTSRKSGFTMLELLAVLAIVLILSAILFPAIQSAQEKSQATVCSNNIKQMCLAVIQYEQDRGQYPAGRKFLGTATAITDVTKWSNAISPYMKCDPKVTSGMGSNPVGGAAATAQLVGVGSGDEATGSTVRLYQESYRCPSVSGWDVASYNMSYGYNYQYLGNADPRSVVTATQTNQGFVNFPVSKGAIQRTDRTICIADSDGTGYNAYRSAQTWQVAGTQASTAAVPNNAALGAFAYLIDPTFLPVRNLSTTLGAAVPEPPLAPGQANSNIGPAAAGLVLAGGGPVTLALDAAPIQQGGRSIISSRHKGAANVGFVDGHVESIVRENCYLRAADVRAPRAANQTNTLFASNELWNGFGVDNDANGNGQIDANLGERIYEENEAYNNTAGTALSAFVTGQYNPRVPGVGNAAVTGLAGNYAAFGPGGGLQVTFGSQFLTTATGPTLPHAGPFDLSYGSAGLQ